MDLCTFFAAVSSGALGNGVQVTSFTRCTSFGPRLVQVPRLFRSFGSGDLRFSLRLRRRLGLLCKGPHGNVRSVFWLFLIQILKFFECHKILVSKRSKHHRHGECIQCSTPLSFASDCGLVPSLYGQLRIRPVTCGSSCTPQLSPPQNGLPQVTRDPLATVAKAALAACTCCTFLNLCWTCLLSPPHSGSPQVTTLPFSSTAAKAKLEP